MLSLSDLNANDFHEYLKPICIHQIKVPDGEYTFPMLQRYLHVKAGLASAALARPITQALEDQDAAPVAEAGDTGKESRKVIDPRTGKIVEVCEGGSYYDSGGGMPDQRNQSAFRRTFGLQCPKRRRINPSGRKRPRWPED